MWQWERRDPPSARLTLAVTAFWFCTGFFGCLQNDIPKKHLGPNSRLIEYVDTRVGTGGTLVASGHVSPAVTVPFGSVQPGPDTATVGSITSSSGYHYGDTEVLGFSQTRYFGTGAKEGGVLRVIPAIRPMRSLNDKNKSENVLLFLHDNETAEPGYYSVYIDNKKVLAEITATQHVAFHRYTFEKNSSHLVIDLSSKISPSDKHGKIDVKVDAAKGKISGHIHHFGDFSARNGGLPIYFVMQLDTAPQSFHFVRRSGEVAESELNVDGEPVLLDLEFNEAREINLKIALSYVSEAGAERNFALEAEKRGFDEARTATQDIWESVLSRIRVQGDQDDMQIFYASLYRSFLMPNVFSDVAESRTTKRAAFVGFSKKPSTTNDYAYYTNMSLWDTFRTVHPLYNLIAREEQKDMIQSVLDMGKSSGMLPRWPSALGCSQSMLGKPASIMLAESYLKGVGPFDGKEALRQMIASASPPGRVVKPEGESIPEPLKECMQEYIRYGYCPSDASKESVSLTLEYAYGDDAIFRLAKALNDKTTEEIYQKRSANYKNLWNEKLKAFVPRKANGDFINDFSWQDTSYTKLTSTGKAFAEGSANQWRWYVPYRLDGLVELFGNSFVTELNMFFAKSPAIIGAPYPGVYYWHGNEPDLHAAYAFNAANRPDLTQKWVRWVMQHKYKNSAFGLDGDDDAGTLSAWYVFSALGFYPIAGTDDYLIGSPLFREADLKIKNEWEEKNLHIQVDDYSAKNIYVKAVEINGKYLSKPAFKHTDIQAGGTLIFHMNSQPVGWNSL